MEQLLILTAISTVIQKDESTAFPDIGDGLNYIFNFFDTDSYKDGVTFNWQETLDVGATYSNEGIAAYGRTISTKDIIGAKNSISFNSTDLTTVANAESYIFFKWRYQYSGKYS